MPEYITAQEALAMAAEKGIVITLATLLAWVEKHELGFQPGGVFTRWYIHRNKFEEFLNGKKTA